MKTIRANVVLLCCILLVACAVRPPVAPSDRDLWLARKVVLTELQAWSVTGRIGVTTEREGWHASLFWTQQGQDYLIDLIGPLGQGRIRIQGDASGVTVQTADGRVLSAEDPELLLKETVGVAVPVTGLKHWIRGLPAPIRHTGLSSDDQGRLTHLEQGGWVIDYTDYRQVENLDLPTRIRARQGDIQVRLAIGEWNLAS